MSNTWKDKRKHRRRVAGTLAGLQEHEKRADRRRNDAWRIKHPIFWRNDGSWDRVGVPRGRRQHG